LKNAKRERAFIDPINYSQSGALLEHVERQSP
jgi:hypothetical protein